MTMFCVSLFETGDIDLIINTCNKYIELSGELEEKVNIQFNYLLSIIVDNNNSYNKMSTNVDIIDIWAKIVPTVNLCDMDVPISVINNIMNQAYNTLNLND